MATLSGNLVLPSSGWPAYNSLILVVVATIGVALARTLQRPDLPRGAWADKGWPIFGSPRFFHQRDQFLREGQAKSPNGHFSFYYGRWPIVAVSGDEGREALFTSRGLDLVAAVRVLFTPGPNLDKLLGRDMGNHFKSVYRHMTSRAVTKITIPDLVEDVDAQFRRFDISKPINPFMELVPVVFTMIHRGLGCHDMAARPEETMMWILILILTTPTGIMFPMLPTPFGLMKLWSMFRLYRMLSRIVAERRRSGKREEDAVQFMMGNNDSILIMVLYLCGALIVALANTSSQVAWLQCFIASDAHWYARIREEVDAAVAKHRESDDETPARVLSRLSMEQWEKEFPIIQAAMTDSIRLILPGPSVRRNISGKDLVMGKTGVVVPKDALVLYCLNSIHFDPQVYKDPYEWDPSRFLNGAQEGKQVPLSYLGWGAGMHPCLGMKMAKLFVTIVTATLISQYDFQVCDEKGNPRTEPLPVPARYAREGTAPVEGVFLKLDKRAQ